MAVTINGSGVVDVGANASSSAYVRLYEDTDNGTNYVDLIAPSSIASNRVITLPDNTGTVITTASTGQVIPKAALPTGSVLQVVSTALTSATSYSVASGATQAITGLSVSITPTSSTSKIMVFVTANIISANVGPAIYLLRGATPIGIGDAAGSRTQVSSGSDAAIQSLYSEMQPATIQYLDSPATTSSTTYSVSLLCTRSTTDTIYVNRSVTDTSASNYGRYMSSITVMEISA